MKQIRNNNKKQMKLPEKSQRFWLIRFSKTVNKHNISLRLYKTD